MKLIVEMEMPKHGCCDCMVELMGLCVIQDKDVPLTNENGDYPTELPKGCPIKGVLPEEHGDLIDRDVLLRYEQDACELCKWGYSELIRKQQPIIAAERKADGNDSD